MATRKYSLDKGKTKNAVTDASGSATTVTAEFTIDLADAPTKRDAILALEAIRDYIQEHKWPPA